jgi:hypothetical protein
MYEVQILWKEKFSKSYEPPRGDDGDAREELAAGVISPGTKFPVRKIETESRLIR